jgi:hypothetical protein
MAYGCSKLTALLLLYSVFIVLYLPEYFKEKMQEYQVCFVKFAQRQKRGRDYSRPLPAKTLILT